MDCGALVKSAYREGYRREAAGELTVLVASAKGSDLGSLGRKGSDRGVPGDRGLAAHKATSARRYERLAGIIL
jgi:hypothetical protein